MGEHILCTASPSMGIKRPPSKDAQLTYSFMTMVEKSGDIQPMNDFFTDRADDFASLEVVDGEVVSEHLLVWTEYHNAYSRLVEDQLGVPDFCQQNACSEEALMTSMEALVCENKGVLMFFDGLVSTTDYDSFLKLAYNVKMNQHCFKPHLSSKCSRRRAVAITL